MPPQCFASLGRLFLSFHIGVVSSRSSSVVSSCSSGFVLLVSSRSSSVLSHAQALLGNFLSLRARGASLAMTRRRLVAGSDAAQLAASSRPVPGSVSAADTAADLAADNASPLDILVQDIRTLGHVPKRGSKSNEHEKKLANRIRNIRQKNISAEHQLLLDQLFNSFPSSDALAWLAAVRDLGHYPMEKGGATPSERSLGEKLRRNWSKLSAAVQDELLQIKQDSMQRSKSAQQMEKATRAAEAPPCAMENFSEEADNRIEQDLLLMANGLATKEVKTRLSMYREALRSPAGQTSEILRKYKRSSTAMLLSLQPTDCASTCPARTSQVTNCEFSKTLLFCTVQWSVSSATRTFSRSRTFGSI